MKGSLELLLAYHCSPALLGIKSANLINCSIKEYPNIEEELEKLNKQYNPRICFKVLSKRNNKLLVLVYQPKRLEKALFNKANNKYLLNKGYLPSKNINDYINTLANNINNLDDFPHEIGVFLNYSLDDVINYENGNSKCKYVGYWKIYSNVEEKLKIFNSYTRCRNKIVSLLNKGYSLQAII